MVPNKKFDVFSKPLFNVDEVETIFRQKTASLIGHIFQLIYAAVLDALINEEKVNRCNGCAIDHPSQTQHWCVMMDSKTLFAKEIPPVTQATPSTKCVR